MEGRVVTFRDRLVALKQVADAICPDSRLDDQRREQILRDPVILARSREVFLYLPMMSWVKERWNEAGIFPGFGQVQARLERISVETLSQPEAWRKDMAQILCKFAAWSAMLEDEYDKAPAPDPGQTIESFT